MDRLHEKDKVAKQYVRSLSQIILCLLSKDGRDVDLLTIRDKFNIAKENPYVIVIHTGPYIWKFRERIKVKDTNFLLEYNYMGDEDKTNYSIELIIQKIKTLWSTLNRTEQKIIFSLIEDLFSYYAQFIKLVKN